MSGCCGFRLRLLRPGLLPGSGHFRLPGPLRDRLMRGIWIRGGVVAVSLATRPLEQRVSIPHLGPTARQRARPAELSGRQGGLWLHCWGLAVVSALQAPPLPLSTSHSHGSSLEPFYGSCYLFSVATASLLVPGAVTYFPLRVSPIPLANCRAQGVRGRSFSLLL